MYNRKLGAMECTDVLPQTLELRSNRSSSIIQLGFIALLKGVFTDLLSTTNVMQMHLQSHTSQLKGTHLEMRMSYLMLQLTECCGVPSVCPCICVNPEKRYHWEKEKSKRMVLKCFYGCSSSFRVQFLLFDSSWPSEPIHGDLSLSLIRSTMVKMAQRLSLAHTRACRCKVSSSPAPPTIFGWNFPLTRRRQQQASSSHTIVSHTSFPEGEGGWGGGL